MGRPRADSGNGNVLLVVYLALFVDGLRSEEREEENKTRLRLRNVTCSQTRVDATVTTDRADVQRQNEDDEKAQVPGQQRAEQDHALLLLEVAIAVQQEERQEEHHHDLDAQRGPAHPARPLLSSHGETCEGRRLDFSSVVRLAQKGERNQLLLEVFVFK